MVRAAVSPQRPSSSSPFVAQRSVIDQPGAFVDGTGKAKGVRGKGSFTCRPAADDANACHVEGEYELPK